MKSSAHIACALAALVLALAIAVPSVAVGAEGDVGDAPLELAPVTTDVTPLGIDQLADSTTDGSDQSTQSDLGAPIAADPTLDTDAATKGSDAQLEARREQLVARRSAAQDELIRLEALRTTQEDALDGVLGAYAERISALFAAGETDRLQALTTAHKEADPTTKAAYVAALVEADRLLLEQEIATRSAVAAAAAKADAQRAVVLQIGTTIDAVQAVVLARAAGTATPGAARSGPIDADFIFASGPIPGIGYWGAMGGTGSIIGGLAAFGTTTLGAVGCTPPTPELRATGAIEQGEASWYGPGFHGNATANGEPYDQEALTAAHPTLPFGTIVRVTSSTTGQCVFLRINDRGPFVGGRIIDLSHAGATAIGMSGTSPVQVEVWAAPGAAPAGAAPVGAAPAAAAPAATPAAPAPLA